MQLPPWCKKQFSLTRVLSTYYTIKHCPLIQTPQNWRKGISHFSGVDSYSNEGCRRPYTEMPAGSLCKRKDRQTERSIVLGYNVALYAASATPAIVTNVTISRSVRSSVRLSVRALR